MIRPLGYAARMEDIHLTDLRLEGQGRAILHGLTLRLGARRIGLIGRNGSGKTTLLRLIAGLVAPSGGTVRIGALDPFADRRGALAKIGILFQSPDSQILFPTVEEELAFGLTQQGMALGAALLRVRGVLAAAGRADWAGRPVGHLSQGQKQWLCLQAVLLMAPETLLLDEPFAALDLPTAARLRRHLAGLAQRLIVIAHRPEDVADCDEVIWLEAGRLAGSGTPAAVLPGFMAEMARLGALDGDD